MRVSSPSTGPVVARRIDISTTQGLTEGVEAAISTMRRGLVVALPTESSYAVATDAFRADGIDRIRQAKGRSSSAAVSVVIGSPATAEGLLYRLSDDARALMDAFWPGMVTFVGRCQPSLAWNVGGSATHVVSVRMPSHPAAWRIARALGPTALTAANAAGQAVPRTADEVVDQLGDSVGLILDAGPIPEQLTSTIVDVSADVPVILKEGAVSRARLAQVCAALGANRQEASDSAEHHQPGTSISDDGPR